MLTREPRSSTSDESASRRHDVALALWLLTFLGGTARLVYLAVNSPGTPVHDEITHVLIAREAWSHPEYVLNAWGRPVNTALYMIPSLAGLAGARAFSILMAAAAVVLTTVLARRLRLSFWFLIPALLMFQPWYGDLAYAAITEVPFALLLVVAALLAERKSIAAASVAVGLLPLVRYEGIVLVVAWGAYLSVRGIRRPALLAILPLAAYEALYLLLFRESAVAALYLRPSPTVIYGSGSWTHFVRPAVRSMGIPVSALAVLGIPVLVRMGQGATLAAAGAVYFATHTVLYRFGLYASAGFPLFLFPLAPIAALAAASGAEAISGVAARLSRAAGGKAAAYALIAGLTIAAVLGTPTRARPLDREGKAVEQAVAWMRAEDVSPDRVISTHPWFYAFSGADFRPFRNLDLDRGRLRALPAGTVILWDGHYSERLGVRRALLGGPASGWIRRTGYEDDFVIVFEKIAA